MATRNSSGDDENPFYCPSMPAVTFLQTIRRKLKIKNVSNASKKTLPSFLQILDQSVDNEDIYSLLYPSTTAKDLLHTSSDYSPEPDDVSVLFNRTSGRKYDNSGPAVPPGLDFHQPLPGESKADPHGICGIKRRRADSLDSFSDILGPTKHARSSLTVNESSFELSGKADRIHFFRNGPSSSDNVICTDRADQDELTHRFRLVHDELYGPSVGTETPRGISRLYVRLDALLPGTRLRERIQSLGLSTHQGVVDFLGAQGYLDARILDALRRTEIECLDLAPSLSEENGLNLGARDLLSVFAKPNSFLFLKEINFRSTKLRDIDITHIHHLPHLARIWLDDTGIGNEAVFHLVALQRTLAQLDLSANPRVTGDAIPALLALPKLRVLSLFDTSVDIVGLRRLATELQRRKRETQQAGKERITVEIPKECEDYIDTIYRRYSLQPVAPLITDPSAVSLLAPAALRRNLEAHATFNPNVNTGGTQEEMAERLERLLRERAGDLAVRALVWSQEYDESEKHGSGSDSAE